MEYWQACIPNEDIATGIVSCRSCETNPFETKFNFICSIYTTVAGRYNECHHLATNWLLLSPYVIFRLSLVVIGLTLGTTMDHVISPLINSRELLSSIVESTCFSAAAAGGTIFSRARLWVVLLCDVAVSTWYVGVEHIRREVAFGVCVSRSGKNKNYIHVYRD